MVACSPVAEGACGVAVRVLGCSKLVAGPAVGTLGRLGSGVFGLALPVPGVFGFHIWSGLPFGIVLLRCRGAKTESIWTQRALHTRAVPCSTKHLTRPVVKGGVANIAGCGKVFREEAVGELGKREVRPLGDTCAPPLMQSRLRVCVSLPFVCCCRR